MSLNRTCYTLLSILLAIFLIQYLQAVYPSAVLWIPFDFRFRGTATQSKAFLALLVGGLGSATAWLLNMTDRSGHISALDDDDAHKKLYIEKRNRFRNNPSYMEELKQWKAGNNDYDYLNL